jgi:hypothetical protein
MLKYITGSFNVTKAAKEKNLDVNVFMYGIA